MVVAEEAICSSLNGGWQRNSLLQNLNCKRCDVCVTVSHLRVIKLRFIVINNSVRYRISSIYSCVASLLGSEVFGRELNKGAPNFFGST